MRPGRRVADIDWGSWVPTFRATLMLVIRDDRILLIHKQRGIGAGKINGPGGKIDPGETPLESAVRETQEELLITPTGVVEAGRLRFEFLDGLGIDCTVFRADGYDGVPTETAEAVPEWFAIDDVPYDRMWADDVLWFPHLFAGRRFDGRCVFDGDILLDAVIEAPRA